MTSVLRPALCQELSDQLFPLVALFPPPPPEEGGLHVDEPPLGVLRQGGDDAVQDVLNSRPLDLIPNNNKIYKRFIPFLMPLRRWGKFPIFFTFPS